MAPSINRVASPSRCEPVSVHDETADGHSHPDRSGEYQQQHHRRAAQVLGPPQEGVAFDRQRIGKRFELTVDGEVTDAVLAEAQQLAEEFLSNQVIEDVVTVKVA